MTPAPQGVLAVPHPEVVATLAETTRFLPQGAYTTLRTYGGTGVLLLDEHFDRLEESAALLGCPQVLDRAALRQVLGQVLHVQAGEGRQESRLRLTLDCSARAGELWLSLEPLPALSATLYDEGVAVVTQIMQRENPRAKDNSFLTTTQEARAQLGGRINEVLMVSSSGEILEGLSSNFFGVSGGTLYTAEEGVLPGLTRTLILEEAARAAILVRLEPLSMGALPGLDEAFLSSSSRGILPVVEIDGKMVGKGQPGPITQDLSRRYNERVQQEIEWL